jgi:tetratricopeptide (TPR) repeat protein
VPGRQAVRIAVVVATLLASWVRPGTGQESRVPLPQHPCRGRAECEAAAVMSLDAAARRLEDRRADDAWSLVDSTSHLVSRQSAAFAFDWLLAAGFLQQSYGAHARAFSLYATALELRPGDASALFARATALEFSAIPDGFGGVVVSDRDVWRFLGTDDPPSELAYRLANPNSDAPYRRMLLEVLTRQYRDVLRLDPGRIEARLRLGRVLEERGHRDEAATELRAAAAAIDDPFVAAVARLCLARLEPSPEAAARAYRSALEVDPLLQPAWVGLSEALNASGDREGALAAVEHAVSPEGPPLTKWVEYHLGRGRAFPEALANLRARLTHPD